LFLKNIFFFRNFFCRVRRTSTKKNFSIFKKIGKKSDLRVKNYLLLFIDIFILLYFLKTHKILIIDPGIKSTIKVQKSSEHGNGMVGFDIGP